MLSFESVKSRLDREQSLSFLEFNYMILQAYDFLEAEPPPWLRSADGQVGPWGNIVNGIDLTRRVDDRQVWGLTSPLLATSDGRKMGKSAGGATWLSADMLSPYEFWQFWRNTTDADVGRFLKLYTELPVDECDRMGALQGSEINEAKVRLANEVTTLLHGADAAASAEATARSVFQDGGAGGDLEVAMLPAHQAQRRHHRAGPGPVGHRRQRQGGQASGGRRRPARRQRACHRSADALGPGRTGARHQDLGRQEKASDAAHRLS